MDEVEREKRRLLRERGYFEMKGLGWTSPNEPVGPWRSLDDAYDHETKRFRHWTSFRTRERQLTEVKTCPTCNGSGHVSSDSGSEEKGNG